MVPIGPDGPNGPSSGAGAGPGGGMAKGISILAPTRLEPRGRFMCFLRCPGSKERESSMRATWPALLCQEEQRVLWWL